MSDVKKVGGMSGTEVRMRKTKIVCTLGPSTDNEEVLRQMMSAGMNVARCNFSHGVHEDHKKLSLIHI